MPFGKPSTESEYDTFERTLTPARLWTSTFLSIADNDKISEIKKWESVRKRLLIADSPLNLLKKWSYLTTTFLPSTM
jgi:hypothetical protein